MRYLSIIALSAIVFCRQLGGAQVEEANGREANAGAVAFALTEPTAPPSTEISAPVVFQGEDKCSGYVTGQMGVYFLQPHFEKNNAITVTKSLFPAGLQPAGTIQSSVEQDFSYDLIASPIVQLGYVTPGGLGFRGRWFRFEQSSTISAQTAPEGIGTRFSANTTIQGIFFGTDELGDTKSVVGSGLNVDNLDLEMTQQVRGDIWSFAVGGGVKLLHMSQRYSGSIEFGGIAPQLTSSQILSGHNFNGVGPSIVFEGSRPLGHKGLGIYCNARGAILFGSGKQHTALSNLEPIPAFGLVINNISEADARRNDVLPVAELEMGVQYSAEFGRLNPFLRVGLIGQGYFGAGSASSVDGNMGLFGFSLLTGVNF
jgi:hypothetical protein